MRRPDVYTWILLVIGALSVLNGAWMLFSPMSWYTDLPAAIPDYGPFNQHFIRDIGCAFVAFGSGFLWAAFQPQHRFVVLATATLFYALHALVHVHCTSTGCVPPNHWLLDVPSIYVPTAILSFLTLTFWRSRGRDAARPI